MTHGLYKPLQSFLAKILSWLVPVRHDGINGRVRTPRWSPDSVSRAAGGVAEPAKRAPNPLPSGVFFMLHYLPRKMEIRLGPA